MANIVLHKANSRGQANHGWLKTYHTFSFADYFNLERVNFGTLRVLNDDYIAGGGGFGMHPHDNMEIVTILLKGALEHKDSMGNVAVIRKGEIQAMSAGTGILHSEYNHNKDEAVELLQIWVYPNKRNVTPRYSQMELEEKRIHNNLLQIVSPDETNTGVTVHQDAWFHLGELDNGFSLEYAVKKAGNGVYAFVIKGDVTINGQALNERDGLGLWNVDKLSITANSDNAKLLLMDIPMVL